MSSQQRPKDPRIHKSTAKLPIFAIILMVIFGLAASVFTISTVYIGSLALLSGKDLLLKNEGDYPIEKVFQDNSDSFLKDIFNAHSLGGLSFELPSNWEEIDNDLNFKSYASDYGAYLIAQYVGKSELSKLGDLEDIGKLTATALMVNDPVVDGLTIDPEHYFAYEASYENALILRYETTGTITADGGDSTPAAGDFYIAVLKNDKDELEIYYLLIFADKNTTFAHEDDFNTIFESLDVVPLNEVQSEELKNELSES